MRECSKWRQWCLCIYVYMQREDKGKRPKQREKQEYQAGKKHKISDIFNILRRVFSQIISFQHKQNLGNISKLYPHPAHPPLETGLNRRISWNEMWRNVDQNIKKLVPCSYQTYISCQSHHEPCKPIKMVSVRFHSFYGKRGDSNTIKGRCARERSRVQAKYLLECSLLASAYLQQS